MPEPEVVETPVVPDAPASEPTTPVEPSTETPAGEPTPPATEPAPEDRQTKFQQRINRLTREKYDLQRELAAERAARTPTEPVAPAADVEPQETDFADYGSYIKALTAYTVRQEHVASAQTEHMRQQQAAEAALLEAFAPQLDAARGKYEDFDEVVSAPIFAPDTQAMLLQSPHGAEIGYYLGHHPKEAAALNQMTPVAKARQIIALEQQIGAQQTKTVSTAPAPITPVTGTATAVKDPSKMTTDEWMVWNRNRELERFKAKPLV